MRQRMVLERRGRKIVLAPGLYFVGRGEDVDLRFVDPLVSRRHAAIRVSAAGDVTVEDLGSSNGILVNGARIRGTHTLGVGDVLRIGSEEVRLAIESGPSEVAAGAATQRACRPRPLRRHPTPLDSVSAMGRLSPRETQVLRLLARGHSQREVGEMLEVSVKTIETYRARIAEKLELRTRADLVQYAVDAGILRPE